MRTRTLMSGALALAAVGALTGCSSPATGSDAEAKGDITIAVFNGWAESMITSEMWRNVLEEDGYSVTLVPADPAPVFAGMASGDYDFATQVSLPVLHADYIEQFGDDLEDLGAWYDNALITVAVNEDAPIDSLDEFLEHADEFGGRIVGIEPGAGQTQLMEEEVIPGYGLESVDFPTSSTPAMLAELEAAIDAGENVAVSLWEPHWAYAEYPIKSLEDPKGLLGDAERDHTFAHAGFSEEHPEVADRVRAFEMDEETILDIERFVFVDHADDDIADAVDAWIAENEELVETMMG